MHGFAYAESAIKTMKQTKKKITVCGEFPKEQVFELQADLNFTLSDCGEKFYFAKSNAFSVEKTADGVFVKYAKRNEFFRGLFLGLLCDAPQKTMPELFCKDLGFMLDCSRNAVSSVETIKKLIRILAVSGYTYLQLYMEDLYEIDGEPYFGYGRGRYDSKELTELDRYAADFGIELIPCIQTLAHLKTIFRWQCYSDIWDIDDTLLAGEEKTYEFIGKMFASLKNCFRTKKIHIGMDEAHRLGRGSYCDKFGYSDSGKIYINHLKRVAAEAERYGFIPYFWGDMIFKTQNYELLKELPAGARLIYWEYEQSDKNVYYAEFEKLCKNCNPVFAGGAWKWFGFAPHNALTEKNMTAAVEVCKRFHVDDMLITAWGDNGAECSVFSALPSILGFAAVCANDGSPWRQDEALQRLTGYGYDEFMALDLPNAVNDCENFPVNPCKYLFYNDPFFGLMDAYDSTSFPEKYAEFAAKLKKLSARKTPYSYLFSTLSALCECLTYKSALGVEIYKCYGKGDRDGLIACRQRLLSAIKKTETFYKSFLHQWKSENKSCGFDVQDIRFGGLMRRLKHCAETLDEYIDGKIDKIEELESERLPYFIHRNNDKDVWHNSWQTMVTNNPL